MVLESDVLDAVRKECVGTMGAPRSILNLGLKVKCGFLEDIAYAVSLEG